MAKDKNWEYLPEGKVKNLKTGKIGIVRTIGGRKVFIADGQSLADAMIESGKFNGQKNKPGMRASYRKEKEKDLKEEDELGNLPAPIGSGDDDKTYQYYLKKSKENDKLYPMGTLNEMFEMLDRNEKIDKQRGNEPLRENYRKDKGLEEYANKYKEYREEIDKYGGLVTTEKSRILSQELGELEKKYELGGRETIPIMQDYDLKKQKEASNNDDEYKLYKKAMTHPESIDPMTENSTDWEALDKKYRDRFNKEVEQANEEVYNRSNVNGKINQAIREKANKSTNNKNKSYDVDVSDTTTEEYNKRSKEVGFPRSDEHGNYRVEKNGEYEYKMYDKINNPFKAGHESNFYKNLSSEEKKQYNDYIDKGYSQNEIENTLMYKTQDQRMREAGVKTASREEVAGLQEKADKVREGLVNQSMNQAIREKATKNKYEGTKRWGFGYANDDNIPVYDNKIDYGGDFSHANLSSVSDSELKELYQKQSELYNRAVNSSVGDRRTYNGKKDQLFKDIELLRYGNGVQKAEEEMSKRGIKSNNMSETIRREANLKNAFRQYKREHPESKMTLNQFKKMNK